MQSVRDLGTLSPARDVSIKSIPSRIRELREEEGEKVEGTVKDTKKAKFSKSVKITFRARIRDMHRGLYRSMPDRDLELKE